MTIPAIPATKPQNTKPIRTEVLVAMESETPVTVTVRCRKTGATITHAGAVVRKILSANLVNPKGIEVIAEVYREPRSGRGYYQMVKARVISIDDTGAQAPRAKGLITYDQNGYPLVYRERLEALIENASGITGYRESDYLGLKWVFIHRADSIEEWLWDKVEGFVLHSETDEYGRPF